MVDDARQFDLFSCYTDALVLACLVTWIHPATGEYQLANLIALLEVDERMKNGDGYNIVLLPDELLKTSQLETFTSAHRQFSNRIVHFSKQETLEKFNERYKRTLSNGEIIQDYLRQKELG